MAHHRTATETIEMYHYAYNYVVEHPDEDFGGATTNEGRAYHFLHSLKPLDFVEKFAFFEPCYGTTVPEKSKFT